MKKQTNLITTSIFILVLCLGFSVETDWDGEKALARVEEFFSNGLDKVQDEIDKLATMLSQEEPKKLDWAEIKNQFALAKESYKRIEFLLEYHDPEGIKKRINGAPLLTVEKHVPEINVLEPKGFQIIEEHLYADEIDLLSLQSLIKTLAHDFDKTKSFQSKIPMEHRHIFEACRLEIIRIFTLGLTGFDTPGSGFALQEALEAIKGVATAAEAYYPGLLKRDKVVHDQLRYTLEDAIFTLAMAKDFDEFDRLAFLKNYLNPVFKHLLAAQNILGIESHNEAVNEATGLNFKATNIFAKDFLNAEFYASQDPDGVLRDKRAALGRLLFYDPILSDDNSLACASCHQPQKAFTDGLPTSLNMPGKRNTPGLINAVFAEKYFYDNRESTLNNEI